MDSFHIPFTVSHSFTKNVNLLEAKNMNAGIQFLKAGRFLHFWGIKQQIL